VIQARTDADALHHKTKHLRSLAARIARFLKSREKDGSIADPTAKATITAIHDSLIECGECLTSIEALLTPLADPGHGDRPADFRQRINFVCNATYIKKQQNLIKTHVDNLQIDLILLQSLDQSATLKRLQKLSATLVGTAADQRASLGQLKFPDSTEDIPLSRSISSSASEADEDEADVPDPPPLPGCPECRRRKSKFPDKTLAIALAIQHNQPTQVEDLLQVASEDELIATDAEDWTLLHYATHLSSLPSTKAILDHPSSPNLLHAQTKDGQTPLMFVAAQPEANDSCAIAEQLIKQGCNVDVRDKSEDARTALYHAVDGSHSKLRQEMVELLAANSKFETIKAVWEGQARDRAGKYAVLEQTVKKGESETARGSMAVDNAEVGNGERRDDAEVGAEDEDGGKKGKDGKDSLGRRLTNVLTDASR
jgi:hypothetical protein